MFCDGVDSEMPKGNLLILSSIPAHTILRFPPHIVTVRIIPIWWATVIGSRKMSQFYFVSAASAAAVLLSSAFLHTLWHCDRLNPDPGGRRQRHLQESHLEILILFTLWPAAPRVFLRKKEISIENQIYQKFRFRTVPLCSKPCCPCLLPAYTLWPAAITYTG